MTSAGRRRPRLAALFAAALLCGVAACQRRAAPRNVLFVVVDTLRADRLGVYGGTRGLTPFLDELAGRGAVFANAYAASSWTCPSVASLFTSRYPTQHNAVTFGSHLVDEEVTLAERLRAAHYVAGGFSANIRLMQELGYAQGFAQWRAAAPSASGLAAAQLNEQALAWLDANSGAAAPLFLYLHFMEPHTPYSPPEPFRSRFARDDAGAPLDESVGLERLRELVLKGEKVEAADVTFLQRLYDGEVAAVDDQIRRLFAALDERGFLDDAVVVVTADHGEEFVEHGGIEHGKTLYEESVRVPLLLVGPGIAAGSRVDQKVSLLDVAPTVLDLLGLAAEARFEGRSLLPALRGEGAPAAAPDVILQLIPTGIGKDMRVHDRGIVRGADKLLVRTDGASESYDLTNDPAERSADPERLRGAAPALREELERSTAALRERGTKSVTVEELDEAAKEKLRALGYLSDQD